MVAIVIIISLYWEGGWLLTSMIEVIRFVGGSSNGSMPV